MGDHFELQCDDHWNCCEASNDPDVRQGSRFKNTTFPFPCTWKWTWSRWTSCLPLGGVTGLSEPSRVQGTAVENMALTGFVLTAAAGNYAELRTFLDLTKEKLLIRLSRPCKKKHLLLSATICFHLLQLFYMEHESLKEHGLLLTICSKWQTSHTLSEKWQLWNSPAGNYNTNSWQWLKTWASDEPSQPKTEYRTGPPRDWQK